MGMCNSNSNECVPKEEPPAPSLVLVCDQSDLLTPHPSTLKSSYYAKFSLKKSIDIFTPSKFSFHETGLDEKVFD